MANGPRPRDLIIHNVTIVDLRRGSLRKHMSVLVTGTRIAAIGRAGRFKAARNAETIQGRGRYLIPGLWDMHAHLGSDAFDRDVTLPLFLANGVTGIRVMSGHETHYLWRQQIADGSLLGPRMVVASEPIEEAGLSPEQARAAVRAARIAGADFFKVRDQLPRDSYFALVDEARHQDLPLAGHTPGSMGVSEVTAAGQRSIEHFTGLEAAEQDPQLAQSVAASFRHFGTWHCPTLVMRRNYSILDNPDLGRDPRLASVKPQVRASWIRQSESASGIGQAEWAARREIVARELRLVGEFHRQQVGILAGTDNGNPYTMAGFGIHDELELLVRAGLSPLDALRAATTNPARFFGEQASGGLVEAGAGADLLLLEDNPLRDIRNTLRIAGVMANGRWLPRGTTVSTSNSLTIQVGSPNIPTTSPPM